MRIRFTLDITRTPKPAPPIDEPEPDFINNQGYSHIENAHQQVLGFTPNPTETYNRTDTK